MVNGAATNLFSCDYSELPLAWQMLKRRAKNRYFPHRSRIVAEVHLSSTSEARRQNPRDRGFTIVEALIVIAILLTVSAITMIKMQPMIQQIRANAAMDQVMGQLRIGREAAIAERRNIIVQFTGNNTIQLTRVNVPAGQNVLSTLAVEPSVVFMTFPGVPDTPDGFGNAAPLYFEGINGGPVGMQFQSDGTFVDGAGNLVNGTVFLGIAGVPSSARAVTVLGATGRVRSYKSTPSGWIQ
jgi:prepilin-type N-terminal cleavage/methylation domain-containing protein